MGLVLVLRKVSDSQLEDLHKNPREIVWYLFGQEPERGLLERLQDVISFLKPKQEKFSKDVPKRKWVGPGENEETDLDKAWHALHFLFTDTAYEGSPPASYLLHGKPIGNIEVGWGEPAWSLDTNQV